ncbi:hypothetical protein [Microbacterium sp.]|uniref:hypothetical protein n=1 Tax=Microbacterium sp. TaxID=51671 RepID=UPI003C7830D1
MSSRLLFPDPPTAADVVVFAQRAARLGDGALRLKAQRGTLALTVAALAPLTLLDKTPTILGMRATRVDAELECDLVVDAAVLAVDAAQPTAVTLPDTAVTAPWAGISPPRAGWSETNELPAALLAQRAQWGIAVVAETVPDSPGEEIVHALRAQVWGEADDELGGLPRGVAFAAFALGFIGGEESASVHTAGPWTRVSLARGHVLVRRTTRVGLTQVRETGRG